MQERMKDPMALIPDARKAIQALHAVTRQGGVPPATLALVQLRASQINGCSVCVQSGALAAKNAGETDERLFTVGAWRDAPHFTAAERGALALTEAVTRLADRPDPVPDDVWDAAAKHFNEKELLAILLMIATANVANRLNVSTRQVAAAASDQSNSDQSNSGRRNLSFLRH